MFSPNQLIDAVFLALAVLFGGVIALACAAVGQRIKSDRRARERDRCRLRISSILQGLISQTLDYPAGLSLLREELKSGGAATTVAILAAPSRWENGLGVRQRLAEELGLVQAWQRVQAPALRISRRLRSSWPFLANCLDAFNVLGRAEKLDRLGRIRHQASWRLLAGALDDPSPDVREVAIRSLAALGEPLSFPYLVKHLRAAAAFPEGAASQRALTAAFASFPLRLAGQLASPLQDPNARLRFLASRALREMVASRSSLLPVSAPAREAGQEVTRLVLTRLPEDENPEVRAAAADLSGWFSEDAQARRPLLRLIKDPEWFVRLHAVRALGQSGTGECVDELLTCITDGDWRVREAAVQAIARSSPDGRLQLVSAFLQTEDSYAREQIVEELQFSGMLAQGEAPSRATGG
ncbi:MAG: HEAT repeat domain-containing protein, partial [Terriglobia bacterium]